MRERPPGHLPETDRPTRLEQQTAPRVLRFDGYSRWSTVRSCRVLTARETDPLRSRRIPPCPSGGQLSPAVDTGVPRRCAPRAQVVVQVNIHTAALPASSPGCRVAHFLPDLGFCGRATSPFLRGRRDPLASAGKVGLGERCSPADRRRGVVGHQVCDVFGDRRYGLPPRVAGLGYSVGERREYAALPGAGFVEVDARRLRSNTIRSTCRSTSGRTASSRSSASESRLFLSTWSIPRPGSRPSWWQAMRHSASAIAYP
jgi:hypothetical protein